MDSKTEQKVIGQIVIECCKATEDELNALYEYLEENMWPYAILEKREDSCQ